MKRKLIAIATIAAIVTAAWATQRAWVKISGNFTNGISLSGIDSVKFDETGQNKYA